MLLCCFHPLLSEVLGWMCERQYVAVTPTDSGADWIKQRTPCRLRSLWCCWGVWRKRVGVFENECASQVIITVCMSVCVCLWSSFGGGRRKGKWLSKINSLTYPSISHLLVEKAQGSASWHSSPLTHNGSLIDWAHAVDSFLYFQSNSPTQPHSDIGLVICCVSKRVGPSQLVKGSNPAGATHAKSVHNRGDERCFGNKQPPNR